MKYVKYPQNICNEEILKRWLFNQKFFTHKLKNYSVLKSFQSQQIESSNKESHFMTICLNKRNYVTGLTLLEAHQDLFD